MTWCVASIVVSWIVVWVEFPLNDDAWFFPNPERNRHSDKYRLRYEGQYPVSISQSGGFGSALRIVLSLLGVIKEVGGLKKFKDLLDAMTTAE